jgi:hypothetical protein
MPMATLAGVVDHLDRVVRVDCVQPAAQALARRQVSYGVRAEHYGAAGTAPPCTLEQDRADRSSPRSGLGRS